MLTKTRQSLILLLLSLASANVLAQPTFTISDGEGAEGSGTPVVLNMGWESDNLVVVADLVITYDSANLSVTESCSGQWQCNDNGSGTIIVLGFDGNAVLDTGAVGTLSFDVSGAAVGDYTITVVPNEYGNAEAGLETPDQQPEDNGHIAVLGPAFSGTPNGLNSMTVIQNQPNPSGTLDVTNTGGAGTTLTGSCAISSDPGGVFGILGGNTFTVLAGDPADTITVDCDSTANVDSYTGTLTCSPDGLSPVDFALACNVTDGPQPVYGSVPAPGSIINMSATYEGDPIPDATIEIDNDAGQVAGELVSELISTAPCSMTSGDTGVITVSSGGTYSILAGGAHAFVTVSCDSSQTSFPPGFYQATLTCPHNAAGSPAEYDVRCEVGEKQPAVLATDPVDGTATDMTPGDVKTGDTINDQVLTFTNTVQALGASLDLQCGVNGDPGEIDVTALQTNTLAPGESTSVTFSCDNTVAHDSLMDYSCNWNSIEDTPPMDNTGVAGGSVSFTYECEVRDAEVNVVSTPPSGSTLTEQVPGGGSATFNVVFGVEADEGIDGNLVSCTVDDAANFQILSPAFPATIPSDGTVTVTVQGNDPGGVDELSTILRCVYEDSNTPDGGEEWTYNLVMEIGSFATFRVTKDFVDDNPATVRVELHCNHGLPLIQGFNISNDQDVNFVLGSFADGEPDCTVTEVSADGYETTYYASGQSNPSFDGDGCYFDNVGRGDVNICNITNEPLPVEIDITKEWFMAGNAGNNFAEIGTVTVSSPTQIVDGYPCNNQEASVYNGNYCQHLEFYGPDTDTQTVLVYPHWEGVEVFIEEDVVESYIESENDCGGSVTIYPGQGGECTVTNSVFFEGIPTLNQYGLALMALLMLGVGMVGFRRFS